MKTLLLSLSVAIALMADSGTAAIVATTNPAPPTPLPHLSNISTRAHVETGDNVVIGGVVVRGSGTDRGIIFPPGPQLTQHGVRGAMHNPTFELYDGSAALIAFHANWGITLTGRI